MGTALKIIKDIFVILFSISVFYAVTHNPITHPKAEGKPGAWSIELHQHPLILGIAGHNYLALRNDKGVVEYELHGLPTDTRTGTWKYVGRSEYDILQIWEFSTSTQRKVKNTPQVSTVLLSGEKEQITELWGSARLCGTRIDSLRIPYPPFGVSFKEDTRNSNSVAYTLSLCMNINPHRLGIFTPGWEIDLLSGRYK